MPTEPSLLKLDDRLVSAAAMLHALRECAMLIAPDTRTVVALNAAATALLHLTPEAAAGRSLADFTPAAGESPSAPSLIDCASAEGVAPTNVKAVDTSGRVLTLDVSLSPLAANLALVIMRESQAPGSEALRRAQQAESSLRQSEAEFRNLAENCPYIITRLDSNGRHVYMSPAILTMGLTPEFFLGKTHAELGFPPEFGANVRRVLDTGLALNHEYVQPAGDREDVFFTRLVPEFGPDGTPTHVLAITQDVTERKRSEEAIARHVAELARINAQLREADRYKDEFLSVISHELRTPLNFIAGFASILDDEVLGPLSEYQHDATGKILLGADRMLHLVDDLLDYAKVQAGKLELDRAPTDYNQLVGHAAELLRPLVDERKLVLTHEVAFLGVPTIDAHRVTQVLTNLISNAIKFTDAGGRITIRAFERDGQLVTEVTDTGVGIAEADVARLFQRFSQLDTGPTRRSGGTGLGLAITRALVQAHGGDVDVTSQPGVGSTFTFRLPLEV